jgi:phage-related protein
MKKVDLENTSKILKEEKKDLENAKLKNKIEKESIETRLEVIKNIETQVGLSKKLKKEKEELEKATTKNLAKEEKIKESLKENAIAQSEIKGILKGQDAQYNTLTAALSTINRQIEDQNKLLGLSGAVVGSLNTALGSLGFGRLASALGIGEAQSEMDSFAKKIVQDREEQLILEREISDELKARANGQGALSPEVLAEKEKQLNNLKAQNAQYMGMNGQIAVLKKGISSMGSSLMKNLTDPLALTLGFVTQLFDALRKADKATGELARQFGTSYDAASNIRQELNDIANSTGNVNITTEKLQKSLMAVNAAFGANAKLSEEELVTFTRLTEEAGYTADELMGIYKISKVTGKSLDDNTKEILGTAAAFNGVNKLAINEKEVLKEVNKTSNAIKLSLGGGATELAKAVLQAKQFGINLEQADKIAEGLLNFESSITSELEAELLTGKSLNFERARLLALNNDIAGAAAEVLKQVKSSAEFTNMNRLQQEAIAKSVGMTRDELANSLVEREALAKLDVEGAKTAQEAYETLKKQGLSEQEIAEKLGNTKLEQQLRSQSVQERFNATVEKLKEVFISLADPILEIANGLTPAFTVLGYIASTIGKILKFFTSIGDGIIPKIIGGLITIRLLTGSIGKGLLNGLVAPFKIAGQGLAMFLPKIGALGKLKGFLGGGSKIASVTPPVTPPVGGGRVGGLSSFTSSLNPAGMLKGAAAMLVLSGALYIAAKAFQEFGEVEWKDIAKGTVALGGLTIAALALSKVKGKVIEGALAIAVLGAALLPAAYAFNKFASVEWSSLAKAGVALIGLGIAASVLAPLVESGMLFLGALGIAALGASLIPLAYALKLAGPGLESFGKLLSSLAPVIESAGKAIKSTFEGIGAIIKSVFEGIGAVIESIGKSISTVITSIADSIVKLSNIDALNLYAVAGGIAALGVSLAAFGAGGLLAGLGSAIGKFFDEDPVEKLNRFASIDSGKILTLADAITKLGESFANFNSTISNIGDVTPIVVTADKIIELHSSLKDKNIIEETITSLTAGIDTLFNKSFSLVQSVFNESPSTIAPTTTEETPSLGKYAKNNLQNNDTTNTNNDTSLDMLSAIEVLKSIDMGIKNLNTKDGNITITLDKDVIGSKVTPVVNTFNNKTKSMVQL